MCCGQNIVSRGAGEEPASAFSLPKTSVRDQCQLGAQLPVQRSGWRKGAGIFESAADAQSRERSLGWREMAGGMCSAERQPLMRSQVSQMPRCRGIERLWLERNGMRTMKTSQLNKTILSRLLLTKLHNWCVEKLIGTLVRVGDDYAAHAGRAGLSGSCLSRRREGTV